MAFIFAICLQPAFGEWELLEHQDFMKDCHAMIDNLETEDQNSRAPTSPGFRKKEMPAMAICNCLDKEISKINEHYNKKKFLPVNFSRSSSPINKCLDLVK
jgi:hypothetical protein